MAYPTAPSPISSYGPASIPIAILLICMDNDSLMDSDSAIPPSMHTSRHCLICILGFCLVVIKISRLPYRLLENCRVIFTIFSYKFTSELFSYAS